MLRRFALVGLLSFVTLALGVPAGADEGMWTFDNFPKAKVQSSYGFKVTDDWLHHVMRSAVRLSGCSSSFVSPQGLVATNHHCVVSCLQQLSTPQRDLVATGFLAKTAAEEAKCPELEATELMEISDVTARIKSATKGLDGAKYQEARKAAQAAIEKECQTSDALRCDVVSLYHGGLYALYKYKRFQDVRVVFAPEKAIAFFGGDPDNFNFARYDLDVSFTRVYENGQPATTEDFFKWSGKGIRDGELAFVAGNPGG
ncbi:MAG TPA: S46 family peptidase, partial [Polyangia bacterium]|nr:S46 family peptidase [Polyangia bacterium]